MEQPDFLAMCQQKQQHDSKRDARVEANRKTRETGRKHITYGCPICLKVHVRIESPQRAMRANRSRAARRGWTPVGA
jgi:hypothetical protein